MRVSNFNANGARGPVGYQPTRRETRAEPSYHARMARRAQHLRCSLRLCEGSERADNKLDKEPSNVTLVC